MKLDSIEAQYVLYYFPDDYSFIEYPELLKAIYEEAEVEVNFSDIALWLIITMLPIEGEAAPTCLAMRCKAAAILLEKNYPTLWISIQGNKIIDKLNEEDDARKESTNEDSNQETTENGAKA